MLAIFSDYTSCVMNVGDCISCCRLEIAFLYHEKYSLTYAMSAEYAKNICNQKVQEKLELMRT